MKKIVFATQNKNKIREASDILSGNYEIMPLPNLKEGEELPEDYFTLHENACQKATYIYEKFHLDCFAEDTGLEVYSLDMEPGVFSARYAGLEKSDEANKQKLLEKLSDKENRKARFRTVIALVEKGVVQYFEGILEGKIHTEAIGNGGFGYDALFIPDGFNLTLAEMDKDEKNRISHRKQALHKLVLYLKS